MFRASTSTKLITPEAESETVSVTGCPVKVCCSVKEAFATKLVESTVTAAGKVADILAPLIDGKSLVPVIVISNV